MGAINRFFRILILVSLLVLQFNVAIELKFSNLKNDIQNEPDFDIFIEPYIGKDSEIR